MLELSFSFNTHHVEIDHKTIDEVHGEVMSILKQKGYLNGRRQ
jgi:hypothetical protein